MWKVFKRLLALRSNFAFQQSSAASLADRHLGPESQLLENSHQQEFLSELETAAELLQSHAQLVLGNALSYAIHQSMEAAARASQTAAKQDNSSKVLQLQKLLYSDYSSWLTF